MTRVGMTRAATAVRECEAKTPSNNISERSVQRRRAECIAIGMTVRAPEVRELGYQRHNANDTREFQATPPLLRKGKSSAGLA